MIPGWRVLLSTRPGKFSVVCFLAGVGVWAYGVVRFVSSYAEGSAQGDLLMYVGAVIVALGIPLARFHHKEVRSRDDGKSGVES